MSDMVELSGKTALVTGGAKRLAAAMALTLAKAGVNVVLHYRSSADAAGYVADEIRALGAQVWTIPADLSSEAEIVRLWREATESGPIDFVVNNASIFPESGLDELTETSLLPSLQVNTLAPFLLGHALLRQDRGGAIVNLLDARIVDHDRTHVAYLLSKRALHSLTKMMAVEFAPRVRVNAVAPGLVLPPAGQGKAYLEERVNTNPLKRYGHVQGVAEAVLFLLRSGFVTGQVIFVDGGRHMRGNMYG